MVKVPGLCYYNAGLFRPKISRISSKTKDFLKSLIIKHFIYKKTGDLISYKLFSVENFKYFIKL